MGWTLGLFGGLIWIPVLALVFLWLGCPLATLTGLLLFLVGALAVFRFAPWRHPRIRYWRLLLPLYLILGLSLPWAIWAFGTLSDETLEPWFLLSLLPLLSPLLTLGGRRWTDGEARQDA